MTYEEQTIASKINKIKDRLNSIQETNIKILQMLKKLKQQDKVSQALKYFRTHATEEQKKEALALLEKDCKSDVTFNDYV